jgi:putative Holliday junction resolvase
MASPGTGVVALDVGTRRIGVAVANNIARIARPLTTITNEEGVMLTIRQLLDAEDACAVVVGLPRGLDGQETQQTALVEQFVGKMKEIVHLPVYFQDEALTSRKAEAELDSRHKPYQKGEIDALAAAYILEDFLQDHSEYFK